MKNKTKLILANMFALVAVVVILTGSKFVGLETGQSSGSVFLSVSLLVVPQMGFFYFYWLSFKVERAIA